MGGTLAMALPVVTSLFGSSQQSNAAQGASQAQYAASQEAIAEQRRQFDALQKSLAPFVSRGTDAFKKQYQLLGLGGPGPQQAAINALSTSPQMQALMQQGENAILQNAAATGGLRGGNTQGALAQFRPAMLSNLIQNQFANLGGLSQMGQSSAAGVGNAGMASAANIGNLLGQAGQAQAGGILAQGNISGQMGSQIASALGSFMGSGGFGSSVSPNVAAFGLGQNVPTLGGFL